MAKRQSAQEILSANLRRLGINQTGAPNFVPQNFLVSRGGPAQATIARALNPTAPRGPTLETVQAIADYFKLEAWMLLVEKFDPEHPPSIKLESSKETEFHRRVASLAKDYGIERRRQQ